jgi:dolichol-phosphate mannosyltransferase
MSNAVAEMAEKPLMSIPGEGIIKVTRGPELSVVVPTFNESENVPLLVDRLRSVLRGCDWEVIFVDDDSPDGTADLIRSIGQRDSRVRCVQRVGRRGLSSACIEGMLASSAPYLAVMDADLQHDEALLPKMLEALKREDLDAVVGSRYMDGGGIGDWSKSRASISRFATTLSGLVVKAHLSDPMSGFFMIQRRTLNAAVKNLSGIGFKILVDLFASSPHALRHRELPYTFRKRQAGESKLDSQVAWDYLMLLLDKLVGRFVPVRFLSFAMVGGSGVFVHLALVWAMYSGMHASFVVSQSVATLVAMVYNYTLNNFLTYRDRRLRGWRWLGGLVSFTFACSVGALANVGIASYIFEQQSGWAVAAIAGVIVSSVWNYAVTSVYTWSKPKAS